MALTSLVVCADLKAVQVLSQILRELNITADHCGDLASAAGRLASEHFDAVVIDCQDQMPAIELIAGVRKLPINRSTLIIALVDGRDQVRDIFGQGANFIVYKPVSVERASSSLRAARGLMAREKRIKLRIALHAPASITYANAENVAATLLDLSEDGLAIQSERRLPPRCKVYFQFNLPGDKSSVRLSGDVVWQDSSGRVGIRFVDVPQTSRRTMNEWIKSSMARLETAEKNAPKKKSAGSIGTRGHALRRSGAFSFIFQSPGAGPSRLPPERGCVPPGRGRSQPMHSERCKHGRMLRGDPFSVSFAHGAGHRGAHP